ncbi:MAG: hypothetical protein LBU43_08110 [Candidatus Accumulibacter sp.]|jgi:hypothetical protein|nr:hypothetical protein [Accumulibacter sp.]
MAMSWRYRFNFSVLSLHAFLPCPKQEIRQPLKQQNTSNKTTFSVYIQIAFRITLFFMIPYFARAPGARHCPGQAKIQDIAPFGSEAASREQRVRCRSGRRALRSASSAVPPHWINRARNRPICPAIAFPIFLLTSICADLPALDCLASIPILIMALADARHISFFVSLSI